MTIIGLFSSSVLLLFSEITDPKNALIIAGWEARILAEVGHCAAKADLTSGPALSFGMASSVNDIVFVKVSEYLKLRNAILAREEVPGENIFCIGEFPW
jgi:hypothetical protein